MTDTLQSRQILLIITGLEKRDLSKRLFQEKISNKVPATLLWMHSKVTVFLDKEAATDLPKTMLER